MTLSASFDDRDGFIWIDGQFVPWRETKIHILNHGLHYASSVFEGIRAYQGHPFKLREHLLRFHNSAHLLGFTLPFSVAKLEEACREVIVRNHLKDCYIRPIAWRGSEKMSISAQMSKIHVGIAAWQWPYQVKPEIQTKGIRMMTSQWRKPHPQSAPIHSKAAGLYMINTLSKHAAETLGFDDALMLDYRGQVAEASGANIFFVIDNKLHTPFPDCFLNGITRQTIIQIAHRLKINVIERAIFPNELDQAQEAFLTGTAAEITPIGQIDHISLTPGPLTFCLTKEYMALVQGK